MKTTLSLLFALAILHGVSIAQPTINIGDVTPVIGSSVTGADASYTDPGAAGANQTWDLSGMVPEIVTTSNYLAPAGLPENGSFPEATHTAFWPIEDTGEFYGYISAENNQIQELGYYSFGPDYDILFLYTNPRTEAVFPLSFNDSFSDTYQSEMENEVEGGTMLSVETGTIDAEVDGYGTLTTPVGTYTDVLRVRYEGQANSTITFGGIEVSSSERTSTEYKYFKAGFPIPLATLRTSVLTSMGIVIDETSTGGFYMDMNVDIEENGLAYNNVQLYPIPASTHIELQLNAKTGSQSSFMLLSATGKMVHQWDQQVLQAGPNQLRLELPELAAGTYLLLINSPEGMQTERVVIGK